MTKWLLASGTVAVITAAALGALAIAGAFDSGDTSRDGVSAEADDGGTGADVVGVCVEGVPDCVDMIVDQYGEAGDDVASDGPGDVDPDEPVTSEPITSGDGFDPDECSGMHNMKECEARTIDVAVADVSQRTGIDAEEITVGDVAYSEWSNACLDAAGPDEACAEVITPGFVVVLEAGGDEYEYHTDLSGNVRLAE